MLKLADSKGSGRASGTLNSTDSAGWVRRPVLMCQYAYFMGQWKSTDFLSVSIPPFSRRWGHFQNSARVVCNSISVLSTTMRADFWVASLKNRFFLSLGILGDIGRCWYIIFIGLFSYKAWLHTTQILNSRFLNSHHFIKTLVWYAFYTEFWIPLADASLASGFKTCW